MIILTEEKIYLKIYDVDKMTTPRTTGEMRGIFKLFGGRFDKKYLHWIIDASNLSDEDILHFRWLIEKVLINKYNNMYTNLDIEVWRVKDGKSEKLRSVLFEIQNGLYPDGKLVLVRDEKIKT